MGKYRPIILLGMAVIIALVATLLAINWLQTKAKGREPVLETQEVAVAKVDLKWGTVLSKEEIEKKTFLKGSLPPGSFSDTSSLVGRVLISPVKANEPILESRLAPLSVKTGGVAAMISPKKRAIAVKVDKTIGVSGFIHPGNRVDVLVTLASGKASLPITKTVLENILVLSAGPEVETKGKEEKASPSLDVINLEVTPEEAEKVALAASEGKLQLTLRNFTDTENVITKGMTIPTLLASYAAYTPAKESQEASAKGVVSKKTTAAKKPAPAAKASPFVVELIKGSKSSEVKFEGGE